jgi:hypothetical protein
MGEADDLFNPKREWMMRLTIRNHHGHRREEFAIGAEWKYTLERITKNDQGGSGLTIIPESPEAPRPPQYVNVKAWHGVQSQDLTADVKWTKGQMLAALEKAFIPNPKKKWAFETRDQYEVEQQFRIVGGWNYCLHEEQPRRRSPG